MKKKITHKKTCPACNGRGKSYGTRRCGACRGTHTVTESIIIEDVEEDREKIMEQLGREVAEQLVQAVGNTSASGFQR